MDKVAVRPANVRRELFVETAKKKGIANTIIVEKDFWVCWVLWRLFHPTPKATMIFKGGTSLGKAFGLIQRFSEDIDLSLDRQQLGFTGVRDPANAASNAAAGRLIAELQDAGANYVGTSLRDALTADFESVLGSTGDAQWALDVDHDEGQTLNFAYPRCLNDDQYGEEAAIRPIVKLEFGARSDQWPATHRSISSYAAEEFPAEFSNPSCRVMTLEAKRTFWEKATLLHMEYYRSPPRPRDSLSRHYYDLVLLNRSPVGGEALADIGLLATVAQHKDRFFRAAWARYDLARPGTLHLVPNDALRAILRKDYDKTQELFFGDPPSFEVIMQELQQLEGTINS